MVNVVICKCDTLVGCGIFNVVLEFRQTC